MRIRTALLLSALLLCIVGCDNVGRAFDPELDEGDPNPTPGESTIQVVPIGGDSRDGRPKVRAAFPADGGWPTTVPIVIEFSETINEASLAPTTPTGTDARVILRVVGTTQVLPCQYDFVAGGRVLVMRPVTELSNAGTPSYEVVMLPDGRDADGLRFSITDDAGLVLTTFQVNQDVSFTDGRILTTYPRDNSREAARETAYYVFFDRPANADSIDETNLRLRSRGGPDLTGLREPPLNLVTEDDLRVVRFTPADVLAGSTLHELVVDETITFGADGVLDFRGRTPFATFETIGPAAPTVIALGNPIAGFPNKVNRTNIGGVTLQVTTPDDAVAGDRLRARIYGGNAATTAVGDLVFVEGTAEVPANGSQAVTIDFTGKLGNLGSPKFDDGSLAFAVQTLRGSQQSGFAQNDAADAPLFDITLPTLVRAGPPASADGVDILTDQESLAFFGRASEAIGAATLVDGVNPEASLFASADDGRFSMEPLFLGRYSAGENRIYSLTLTDRAGNLAAATATGRIVQRGVKSGTLTNELVVEVFDTTTLLPIANARVLVDPGVPALPPVGQLVATTGNDGRATFSSLTAGPHTVTVVRAGFHLMTLYASTAAFVSLPLRPLASATSTLTGSTLFTQAPGTTVLVGSTAFDDPAQLGVRTTNAAPTAIPVTALVPNRPFFLTAFGSVFEPTTVPTFTLQAVQPIGVDLTNLTTVPPVQPAAAAGQVTTTLALLPAAGGLGSLIGGFTVDFATASGIDFANLVGGRPTVRVLASLQGFGGQLLAGVGVATASTGSAYSVNANFSSPAFLALDPFDPQPWIATEVRDTSGRISRHRVRLSEQLGVVDPAFGPALAIPVITSPSGASAAPAVTFDDVLDPAAPVVDGLAVHEVIAEDAAGRRWTVLVSDTDAVGGLETVQFPSVAATGLPGLATGSWNVVVEGRLFDSLSGATAEQFVLAERRRSELHYSRSASVAFTVQ